MNVTNPVNSRLSYPSSHASVSFSVLFQLSLYLYYAHLSVLNSKEINPLSCSNPYAYYCQWLFYKLRSVPLLSLIIVGIPVYLATYISCTRITDYMHHYSDVNAGIMIGTLFAVVSFHHYSRYLVSNECASTSAVQQSKDVASHGSEGVNV